MSKGKYYQEYRKERRRIQSFLRRNRAKGYIFPDNILPDQPKRITPASIRRLKRITPEFLYKKASYVDSETGEILTGTEAVKQRRSESAKRAAKTRKQRKRNTDDEGIYDRITISTWYSQLEVYADGKGTLCYSLGPMKLFNLLAEKDLRKRYEKVLRLEISLRGMLCTKRARP